MKLEVLLFVALGSLLALTVQGQQESFYLTGVDHAKAKFKCPRALGVFPDPDDCAYYYMCVASVGVRRKCQGFLKFDSVTSQCAVPWIATCFDGKKKSTTSTPSKVTKPVTSTTSEENAIVCPSFMGTFPHPTDCSKYFSCMVYIPSVRLCPKKQLFDAVKKSCKPEKDVHCGTRKRPDGYTTTEIPVKSTAISTHIDEISTDILTTITSKPTEVVSETTETVIPTTETVIPTTETVIPTTETAVPTTETTVPTTPERPTGPPDHTCDENDLDCIITETGDVSAWFTCPDDIGSYPHPSSDKLFIFCMNWTPLVKKCSVDLVFSKELLTCVNSLYFL